MQGTEDEVVDLAPLAETHLLLGRMDIDVHHHRRQFQIEDIGRVTAVVEDILKGLTHGMGHQFVPHQTAVDVEELQIGLAAGEGRRRHPAGETQVDRDLRHRQGMGEEALPGQGRQALAQARLARGGRQIEQDPAIVLETKTGLGPGQGDASHHRLDMPQLGLLGAQKFPPGRGVVEEIPDFDSRPGRVRDRLRGVESIAAVTANGPGLVGLPGTGAHLQS